MKNVTVSPWVLFADSFSAFQGIFTLIFDKNQSASQKATNCERADRNFYTVSYLCDGI